MCDALYIHIPFCERKCPYCDFYSVAADEALMDAYTDAAIRSMAANDRQQRRYSGLRWRLAHS